MQPTAIVAVTFFTSQLPEKKFVNYVSMLPVEMQHSVLRYKRWEDAHASLFGKLLLQESFKYLNVQGLTLHAIRYDQNRRPFLNAKVDFNITHSGNYVMCVVSESSRVGIDVEEIKPVQLEDFQSQFSPAQWTQILESDNSCRAFYEQWTQKEALAKADGRGVTIPLHEITIDQNVAVIGAQKWFVREIAVSPEYCSHLVTDRDDCEIDIVEFNF